MEPLVVNARVVVPVRALSVKAVRASGPGGQNVNKTSTKVQLSVDLDAIEGLSDAARRRLFALCRGRLDEDGWLLVESQRTRSRDRNLTDALEKVRALVEAALPEPRRRIPTKPSRGAKLRRLEDKRRTSEKKRARRGAEF